MCGAPTITRWNLFNSQLRRRIFFSRESTSIYGAKYVMVTKICGQNVRVLATNNKLWEFCAMYITLRWNSVKKIFNSNAYLYQFHDFCLSSLSSAMVGNEAIGGFIQSKIRKCYFLSFQNFWCSPDFHFTRVTVQKIISAWTTGMQNAWFLKFWCKWHP